MRFLSRPFRLGALALLTLLPGFQPAHGQNALVLVPPDAPWRLFKGTAEASPADPTAWRSPGFSDADWIPAPAPIWYGEAGLFAGTGTELPDMAGRYSTVFLRTRFTITRPESIELLTLTARCDDGFIAWLNGRRLASLNPPAAEPTATSLAGANAAEPVPFVDYSITNNAGWLVVGDNTLAVQLFNTSLSSSDIVFDGQLTATPRISGAPTLLAVSPTPGLVAELPRITVTFTEPVTGVRAEDLLVNGASATDVSGSGSTYTFAFNRPPFGTVGIGWSTFHRIQDLENPPQRFDLASPGATWAYELIDPDGPSVLAVQPPAGTTVSALNQIEVTFDKAVTGLAAADLLRGGVAATNLTGFGAGPYLFEFPPAPAGPTTVSWRDGHGITSDAVEPHPFHGTDWAYTLSPGLRPAALVITEFMAENLTSYRDEDLDPEDWIEIWNPTAAPVNLAGWSLSRDQDDPGAWIFPAVTIPANAYTVVFASAKDRRPLAGRLHTNFKLNPNGGYLGLFGPELPRRAVSEVSFSDQGPDYSAGRENNTGEWRYFKTGSPAARNAASAINAVVAEVRFSVERGFFAQPFNLGLTCRTPGATIRYTLNGSPPTETSGFVYTNLVPIPTNRVVRAAAFLANALPSRIATHSYLMGLSSTRLRLPALSLVTATNNLFGRTGIMEVSPRNTTQRGPAWERPVSVEYIQPDDNGGFQADCGLRLQGGDYVRGQYTYRSTELPFSKYSYRLYFRGEYGQGRLNYPLFPGTTQESFDTIVLRAGMNDHSNPYLADEFVRNLARDCSQPAAVGTFVHLFINGVYKGYYNPCERIDVDFLRAYHGGGEKWDVIAQVGEVREGDATAFNALRTLANTRDLADPVNYRDIVGRLDLTNFVDYLCPLIYVDADDWPHNNWRAARERVAGGLYRFYVWDAEWAFGLSNGHSPTFNTIANQLSTLSPPWGGTDVQRIFNGLKKAPEFRLLFADRVHRHFFNGGALADERVRARYASVTNRLRGVVPGFNNTISSTWIPQRRKSALQHLQTAGFLASSNAPVFTQHGGRVETGYRLGLANLAGAIYYTTNGTDPRTPFSSAVAPAAVRFQDPLALTQSTVLRARTLSGTNWSAITEATFEVAQRALPLRFTEVMYHPFGGEEFEFVEIANFGGVPADLSGFTLGGIEFRFPEPFPSLAPGAHLVLANSTAPNSFRARHPAVTVAGWFDGSLSNAGERLSLLDRAGQTVTSVTFGDSHPWPAAADGTGASLEFTDPDSSPDDPAAWRPSPSSGGTPGAPPSPTDPGPIRLNEIAVADDPDPDWVELANTGTRAVSLAGWSLSDSSDPRRYVLPAGTQLGAGAFLRVSFDHATNTPGLHTGFGLRLSGETLALYDGSTNRVDAVTFGSLVPGLGLGRLGTSRAWQLTEPTPGSPNEPARTAPSSALVINEWIANPFAGQDDWIEVHNTDSSLPLALGGLYIGTSNTIARLLYPAFIPPSGFAVLAADENPGPAHLGFKLPATGNAIVLFDGDGAELSRVTYPRQADGIGLGRIPDGTGNPAPLPGTLSPGASNYVLAASGPRLNEFMARNLSALPDPDGRFSDWIEIHNPANTSVELGGSSLSLGTPRPGEWLFPAGTRLGPDSYLVVRCNPDVPPSTNATASLQLGRGLPAEGGDIWFFDAVGRLNDHLRYGFQLENRSAGRSGTSLTLLASATPGRPNAAPADLGTPSSARLNEWFSGSGTSAADWIEVFNPESRPVDLGGFLLTDDPSIAGLTNHVVAPLSLLPARGFAHFIADGQPGAGPDHLEFRLDPSGETLRLHTPNATLVDSVDLILLPPGVSEGRLPDGAPAIVRFPGSESPGEANWVQHDQIVINEALAHTDFPLEDAVELYNPSASDLDLSGWYLSNDSRDLLKYRLPAGTRLAPDARHVIYEASFNPPGGGSAFTFSAAHGDAVWLTETDPLGQPTGRRAHARIGASANAESWGRHRTSIGWDFVPLSRLSFGNDLPTSLADFRAGRGLPNAYPRVGPIVFAEIHYRPLVVTDTDTLEDAALEFVELANAFSDAVRLFDPLVPGNTWRIRGGIEFEFPPQVTLAAGQRALIVSFAPTNATALAGFRSRFSLPANTLILGPFRGRLANDGDLIRLERPDAPQAPPHPDAGYIPWLLVEEIHYHATPPWPIEAATVGRSLQRWRIAAYGNDPANWIAGTASPGSPTPPPARDRDFDGLDSDWEIAHGLNPDDPADVAQDPDGDARTNLEEFIAGTDPRDRTSALNLGIGRSPTGEPILHFTAIPGHTYTIQTRDHAAYGPWQRMVDLVPDTLTPGVITVPLPAPSAMPHFYRLVTPSPP